MAHDYSRQEVLGIIEREARERGIPRDDFLRFAYIETGGQFDETVSRGPNGAKGLFQFTPPTATQYGIRGRELDAVANTDAAARLYLDNRRALVGRHERDGQPYLSGKSEPDGLDMYMAHQQGAAGYRSVQAAIATGRFSRDDTRDNILNNVSARDFQRITGIRHADFTRMDDRDMAVAFTRYWDAKFDRVRIPEMGIEPVADGPHSRPDDARRSRPATEPQPVQAEGRWPAPGNNEVNRADKPGEGRGEFGTSRGGGVRTHRGVDIEGNEGDPIAAYAGGTVRVQPNNGAAGNTITIDHGHGVVTRYFHLKDIEVQDGQHVDAGVRIGTMGRTGNTPTHGDTHLHFEMWRNGRVVDPMRHLQVPGQEQDLDRRTAPGSQAGGVLKRDSHGAEVRALQTALGRLGYIGADGKPLAVDGDFGGSTDHAVRAFQQAHGLKPVDGKVGGHTREALAHAVQHPLVSEANHPNHKLYAAIGAQLPVGTRPEVIANVTLQALENGIAGPEQLRGVAVRGSDVAVARQGVDPGDRIQVDLNAPTATLRQMSDHMAQQTRERAQAEEQRRQQPGQQGMSI